ncbi:GH32 C-terminal domain-containing protein [Corynebacterium sp. L4756]|uniref:GH32 C-terminal domain-containing protein n=1 Tax=unclassified Corynebacterium TaxID=2624378 RepID=UPI00374CF9AE
MTDHRPELHFAPESGIVEAPAGALLDGNTWHLFFQYRTDAESSSRWGHTFSEESPFDWLECDDSLAPIDGETGLRAGSVASVGGDVNLYFTSVTSDSTSIQLARYDLFDDVCEISDDPAALDTRVTRRGEIISDQDGFHRFRSPVVVADWVDSEHREKGHAGWLMLTVAGDASAPNLVIFRSGDGENWEISGPLQFEGDPGAELSPGQVVVSPRIIRLRDEVDERVYDVLMVTIEKQGFEHSGYVVGRLHGTTFEVARSFQRLDYGHDFTRPRITNYTPGSIDADKLYDEGMLFGLLNGTGRVDDPTTHKTWSDEGWANAVSLPRVVTLQDGTIFQTPPRGLPEAVNNASRASSWTGLLEVPEGSDVTLSLYDASGNTAATIRHRGTTLELDRSESIASEPTIAPLADGDSDSLTVIVDGSTVEVFADGGQVAMASRVYFDGGCTNIKATAHGDAEIVRDWYINHN